jgi:hypothetical protein
MARVPDRWGRRWRASASRAAAAVCALAVAFAATSQQPAYREDEVKAAFLYHFGGYVEWPDAAAHAAEPITIAVLGANGVAAELREFLPGRRIQGRPVEVRALARIQDLGDDEVLFIGPEQNGRLRDVIASVGSKPVLIVTDKTGALAEGSMVNFQVLDERVRFEISLRRAQDAGLTLSSRLLSAALHVETTGCAFPCRMRPRQSDPGFAGAARGARPGA